MAMIIIIKTWREGNQPKIDTQFDMEEKEEPFFDEASMAVFELERMKNSILGLEFESGEVKS
jgi:hypothetical protein